jgi:hypothetical protein
MNLLEAREILKKKGYTVHRLNECGGFSGGCGGSSSYSSGCGSSGGCGSSYSSGCGGSSSYRGGCGTISRSVRVGCGTYISNSCFSSRCGNYYYDEDEDETPETIIIKGKRYEFAGYNSYYGCAEYTNSRTGKTILDVTNNERPSKFSKIISLARKLRTSEVRIVEIIETLYESGISREIAYNLLAKLNILPDKLLRMPITHVK